MTAYQLYLAAAAVALLALVLWRVRRLPVALRRAAGATAVVTGIVLVLAARSSGGDAADATTDRGNGARLATLENALRAIEDGDRESPRDRWDPQYVVDQLGTDPHVLVEWVRENAAWIPYRGVLRGAAGVLMDRQGSSLDRAVLLATLLDRAGHSVRLAHGEIPVGRALELLPQLVLASSPPALQDAAAPMPAEDVHTVAEQYGLDGAAVESTLERQQQAAMRVRAELVRRVAHQSARLSHALDAHETAERQMRFDAALTALRDHWWVQLESGGEWRDLDLLSAAAAPPAEPDRVLPIEALADDTLHHEIVVRVVTEQWAGGALEERVALNHTLRPAAVIGESIVLQFWPRQMLADSMSLGADGNDLPSRIAGAGEWAAVLTVGRDNVAAGLIDDRGGDATAVQGGGPAGLLGGAISAMAGSTTAEPVLSAVWLEYEFRVPGEARQRVRRAVFDLLGPAERAAPRPRLVLDEAKRLRRSEAMLMRTELLPISCRFAPEFVAHLIARGLIDNRAILEARANGRISPVFAANNALFERTAPTVSGLYSLALARMEWSPVADDIFIERPGLLTSHAYPSTSGGTINVLDATDIVANDVGVRLTVRDARRVRLMQGVLDTNAEALLRIDQNVFGNAGDAYEASEAWVTLAAGDATAATVLDLPGDVRQQIRQELASGHSIVAPAAAVPTGAEPFAGWWRVDPATGRTLGFSANGWGHAGIVVLVMQVGERSVQQAGMTPAMYSLRAAGRRFFVVFHSTLGFCVVREIATNVESRGLVQGFKAVIVENPNQCTYEALFWGSLATLPLLIVTMNQAIAEGGAVASGSQSSPMAQTQTSPMARTQAPPPGRSPMAQSQAAPPGASPMAQSQGSRPGASPMAQSNAPAGGRGGAPRGPRPLGEIEADLQAARRELKAATDAHAVKNNEFLQAEAEAMKQGREIPGHNDAYGSSLIRKVDAMTKVDRLGDEYVGAGGHLGPGRDPLGPYQGSPRSPAPNPGPGSTQDLGLTQPDLGPTLPGGRPGPVQAPVRGGPPATTPHTRTAVGLGGLLNN